jgi:hypothetical protein
MGRLAAATAVVGLAGCELVFGVDTAEPPAIDATVDAKPIDGPPGDVDGDGIPDGIDVCPSFFDPSQHDEDGDLVGDPCDGCPHQFDPSQVNFDGDDLNDACDDASPRVDCIVHFDGFRVDNTGWMHPIGDWVIDGDSMVQTDPTTMQGRLLSVAAYTDPLVVVSGRFVQLGDISARNVGVWAHATVQNQDLPDGHLAEIYDAQGDLAQLAVSAVAGGPGVPMLPYERLDPLIDIQNGDPFYIGFDTRFPPVWVATAVLGSSYRTQVGDTSSSQTASVALRVHQAVVRFDYIMIITTQPSLPCPPRTGS